MSLKNHIAACYAVLAVSTQDEQALIRNLIDMTFGSKNVKKDVLLHSAGILRNASSLSVVSECTEEDAIKHVSEQSRSILVMFDTPSRLQMPRFSRAIMDALPNLRKRSSCVILSAPSWDWIPEILQHSVTKLSMPLPCRSELENAFEDLCPSFGEVKFSKARARKLANAASGLTIDEAKDAYTLAFIEDGKDFTESVVIREKVRSIKSTGYLSFTPSESIDSLGGLSKFKAYLTTDVLKSFDDPKLRVRGIMLGGYSGAGKSLAAKVTGSVTGFPVLRLDIAACKGSRQGESEANLRNAFRIAEAAAPIVLFVDEIDNAVCGHKSSAMTDGGVGASMLGTMLTWLQDHTSEILTVATFNEAEKIPETLFRRFDECFAVGLPGADARMEIAEIHMKDLECVGDFSEFIAELSLGWNGQEISRLIKSAVRKGGCKLSRKVLKECANNIRPISKTNRADMARQKKAVIDVFRPAD